MAQAANSAPQQHKLKLPPPFNHSPASFELIAQGAESLLYKTTFLSPSQPAALKVRPAKEWRHATLDKRLTRARILAEARVLVKLSGEGIAGPWGGGGSKVKDPSRNNKKSCSDSDKVKVGRMKGHVPAVLGLDWEAGWLVMEWIEGRTVKEAIHDMTAATSTAGMREVATDEEELKAVLREMGELVGLLHSSGVVHGDLTTSNIMLRPVCGGGGGGRLKGELVLIDFGLASQSVSDEDRAVDLYVLERAFASTHPREEGLFSEVLKAYAESEGSGMYGRSGKVVLRRLEDVRMRGRKKSMIG